MKLKALLKIGKQPFTNSSFAGICIIFQQYFQRLPL
jgi:hypothetical protein